MNLLKSIFITIYMMMIMGIAVFSGWKLYQGAAPLAWVGVMLTVAPILSVITVLMTFKNVARTSAHLPLINILGALGVALAIWAWQRQDADILAPALAVEGWVDFRSSGCMISSICLRDREKRPWPIFPGNILQICWFGTTLRGPEKACAGSMNWWPGS